MTAQQRLTATDDWIVDISDIASVSLGLSISGQKWTFYSPRLHYACTCIVPRGGVGLSVSVELPGISDLVSAIADRAGGVLSMDQENITILRAFSANDLDGASVGAFSIGARGVVAGADGEQALVKTGSGREIVRIRGGSVSAGLGVELNMGTLSIGAFYGPYDAPVPRVMRKAVQ